MRRVLPFALAAALAGCVDPGPELALDIREPADRHLFASIAALRLRAERDGRALGEADYDPTTSYVRVDDIPYGARTTFVLEGTTAGGDVVARGSTCPFELTAPDGTGPRRVSLSFAPTNAFAPTVGAPVEARMDAAVWTVANGDVLIAGGTVNGIPTSTAELYSVSSSTFAADPAATLSIDRLDTEVTDIQGIGTLLSGGYGRDGSAIATVELYRSDTDSFVTIDNSAIGARAGHRALTLPSDRVILTGGVDDGFRETLASTALLSFQADGTATASIGPALVHARHEHSAVVASGVPVIIGGYGKDTEPLTSIEALVPSALSTGGTFAEIAQLRTARAEATASLLSDGTILVIGGASDAKGTPLVDAELYNPITGLTTVYPLAAARRRHSATLLPDGRVLVIGGLGTGGAPLASVELFVPGVGFVSERPLATPRSGHRAIPLCDGTVLVIGGGTGAEIYTPPP